MHLKKIALAHLAEQIDQKSELIDAYIHQSSVRNPWFSKANYWQSLVSIRTQMLRPKQIDEWLSHYHFPITKMQQKRIGLIFAGNIPLVGFQDFLWVYLSGHQAEIKLSSKDQFVFPALLKIMMEKDPSIAEDYQVVSLLKNYEAIIATGSNNTSRYFEHYFKDYPKILRKNRTSVAVLSGEESEEELRLLGRDVFTYFGLGCRNVTKLYVPTGFNLSRLLELWEEQQAVILNDKYKNNFDYNLSIELLNRSNHVSNRFLIVKQDKSLFSPIGMLHYEEYEDINQLRTHIQSLNEDIQCVVGKEALKLSSLVDFGQTQRPGLFDYPDGVDVGHFLVEIA